MKRIALLVAFLVSTLVVGASIYTFSGPISTGHLNYNFAHIHDTMVGGHGGRLVNTDVANDAGIGHHKLKTPQLVPKAWATVSVCTTTAVGPYLPPTDCAASIYESRRVLRITSTVAGDDGVYLVWLTKPVRTPHSAASAAFQLGAVFISSNTLNTYCKGSFAPFVGPAGTLPPPDFVIGCYDAAGVGIDTGFDVAFFEEDT